jgi:tetratricopeptide (TPR) repeat protein
VSTETRPLRAALERGRASYAAHAWRDAFEWLSRADDEEELAPEDLELLARAAYMLGRDGDYQRGLERAHYGHLDAGDTPRAARCAWWIGLSLLLRGETAPARGWFARGERLLDREQRDCAERGYLRLADVRQHFEDRDFEAAYDAAAEVIEIGERFGDRDLVALGVMEQGQALLELRRAGEGLRLIDESMVAVTSGELSPIVAGIVYCYTIAVCQSAYELRRAQEWTTALTHWCEGEAEMVAHKGVCLVHRAEIMQLRGAWEAALEETRRAGEPGLTNPRVSAGALYVQETCTACEGTSTPRRKPFASQPGRAASRSPVWRCCDSHRARAEQRSLPSAASSARPTTCSDVRRSSLHTSRSRSRSVRSVTPSAQAPSSRRSPTSSEPTRWARWLPPPSEPLLWREARPPTL